MKRLISQSVGRVKENQQTTKMPAGFPQQETATTSRPEGRRGVT